MPTRGQNIPASNPSDEQTYSLEAYFDMEYKAERRHEYLNGQIKAMAYTSPEHGEIQVNLLDALSNCLQSQGCKRFASDRMVYVPGCNKVFYPDIVIVCGEHILHQHKGKMKATLNPSVIVEILSDSTENEDKIDKWDCYRKIASLQQYIMVEQRAQSVHSYHRVDERKWAYSYADEPEESIEIQDCTLTLKDIYKSINI